MDCIDATLNKPDDTFFKQNINEIRLPKNNHILLTYTSSCHNTSSIAIEYMTITMTVINFTQFGLI